MLCGRICRAIKSFAKNSLPSASELLASELSSLQRCHEPAAVILTDRSNFKITNRSDSLSRYLNLKSTQNIWSPLLLVSLLLLLFVTLNLCFYPVGAIDDNQLKQPILASSILSNENFTFIYNGSFLQIDAGREWPFNSKREISFRFKTKSPHGLLVYQTFDHSKLVREEDQENLDPISDSQIPQPLIPTRPKLGDSKIPLSKQESDISNRPKILIEHENSRNGRSTPIVKHLNKIGRDGISLMHEPLNQLSSNSITATASEKLVNSLFSTSPAAAINGNNFQSARPLATQITVRDGSAMTSKGINLISMKDSSPSLRNHRILTSLALGPESTTNRHNFNRASLESNDGSTVLSSSTISSFSASLYELYLKLENGRLKIMYEYGSRLNQTFCGKGLNDDRWHRIDLKVDPELNQMILVLDQVITVEIALSQQQHHDEEILRRNELVFTNSILYLGGLDNNASSVKNVKQRLYMAQFIGCIGQIMLKTDQHTESTMQPAPIDRMVMVRRGCINKCDTDNYCLHKSSCVNYYTHTICDCFGTHYEDIYCWQDKLTTLSMLGYSTLVYRIYDWRDRHHSNINRLSIQFRTLASDSMIFFAYGDLSAQQSSRSFVMPHQSPSNNLVRSQASVGMPTLNISNIMTIHRPTTHQQLSNSNYLSVSLVNGSIFVEVSFGDQPILLSNLLHEKINNRSADINSSSNSEKSLILSDGLWHNLTFIHNNKQLYLHVDNHSINYSILGKNNHLYFDPSVYIGGVPNLLQNETRTLTRPFNLRHKFVGCLKSVYFNQHNILLALKQSSTMADYRDLLGKPRLDSCLVVEPNSLPLTLRSGKSYLTFQLVPYSQAITSSNIMRTETTPGSQVSERQPNNSLSETSLPSKKLTKIEFEYKTPLNSLFLAGGHLRDLSYHDLGGFWTLHSKDDCQLYFTVSSGLTFEPEQIIKLVAKNISCDPKSWFKVSIAIALGEKVLNVTQSRLPIISNFEDEYLTSIASTEVFEHQSYVLKSSIELLHQVQIGGDLAKFGESSSVPFTGCIRKIKINGHSFDSRDFVTNSIANLNQAINFNHQNVSSSSGLIQSDLISSRVAQGHVTLDSCQLVNPCALANFCKNNGTCKVNELGEPECDCSKTGFTGKRCYFSIYKRTNKNQSEIQHEITFKTSDAYIEVPGWRRGDISFGFRTASNPPAIILYQLATSRNHGYFRLTLISDLKLLFEFIVNRKPRKLYLTATHKLNNGEWQQVSIEYDAVNLRLTVNSDSAMIDLDSNDYLGTFEGPLFIGGAPSKYLVGDLSKRNGFTGCFRSLNIDGKSIDLKTYLSPLMPTVTSACKPSCTKNLCQNGGKCIEYWGSYECECSNSIAHSGNNCEINLNTNSMTFVTRESHYVQTSNDSLPYPAYLVKNILLNIRTYQETALILYAKDHLNNFIQLHKNGSNFVLSFNSNNTIVVAQVPIDEEQHSVPNLVPPVSENFISSTPSDSLSSSSNDNNSSQPMTNRQASINTTYILDRSIRISNTSGDGQPIQVKIERQRLRTTFYVNNNFMILERPMILLSNYSPNPWSNLELETVRPLRPKIGSKTYSQIFLANVDEYFSTRLPGFTGCIQGLSIDNELFDFNRAHLTGELRGEYRIGCKMHCDSIPCRNGGICIENWKEDKIQCKCESTSYVGKLCDEDVAAIFNGQSHFVYNLSRKFPKVTTNKMEINQSVAITPNSLNTSISYERQKNPLGLKQTDAGEINFLEVSLAFSTDTNQSLDKLKESTQVLILITRAYSSKYFFLGITPDGSLIIQEDYGNSMSLSRLIKRSDLSYNDGHRHMIRYTRYNQSIQIVVDHQTYLPTMSVITVNRVNRYSMKSVILVGTAVDKSLDNELFKKTPLEGNYTNYSGCISNLVIRMEDILIEPLSEAFGQNLEQVNISSAREAMERDILSDEIQSGMGKKSQSAALRLLEQSEDDYLSRIPVRNEPIVIDKKSATILSATSDESMETIVAFDVEQGKCSPFKKSETIKEERSANEPKFTPLLEPPPSDSNEPQAKPYKRNSVKSQKVNQHHGFNALFYCSLTILTVVGSSILIYVCILQVQYKSEKFRCETPFFHSVSSNHPNRNARTSFEFDEMNLS